MFEPKTHIEFGENRWEYVKIIPKMNGLFMVVLKDEFIPKHIIGDNLTLENAIGCATLNDIVLINR